MWDKIKNTVVIVLAVLGVLFIILMLLPDDDGEEAGTAAVEIEAEAEQNAADKKGEAEQSAADKEAEAEQSAADKEAEAEQSAADKKGEAEQSVADKEAEAEQSAADKEAEAKQSAADKKGEAEQNAADKEAEAKQSAADKKPEAAADNEEETKGNTIPVNIPSSDLSQAAFEFNTETLEGESVTQDIFSDYDITVVHVWGTYCGPCIAEMGDYAGFYKALPDNINLVGVVCDVFQGLDNNVKKAEDILNDAEAGFTNLKTSESVYGITGNFQYIPSSFLVDRDGHVLGALLEGAGFEATKKALEKYAGI